MFYEKVFLEDGELQKIYRERFSFAHGGERIALAEKRRFQEFLGVQALVDNTRLVRKGKTYDVLFNLPAHLPKNKPMLNWFEIALSSKDATIADLLDCTAEKIGFFPGYLITAGKDLEFVMEDEPRFGIIDYVMFIYDGVNHSVFLEAVEKSLESMCSRKAQVTIADEMGNKLLISEASMGQSMILAPVSLLVGGRDYTCQTWEKIIWG